MVEEIDEKTIRQYLLGEMAEAEMSQFEERLMTDDELFERLLVVEDELIDERAADELSAEEQARFDTYFLTTPQRRERLELAQALHDYVPPPVPKPVDNSDSGATIAAWAVNAARSENPSEPVVVDFSLPAKETHSSRWSSLRPYLKLATAAVILIAVGLGTRWLWLHYVHQSNMSQGLVALNQAYSESPTEVRITGLDLPPPSVTRRGEPAMFDYVARDRAEALIQVEAADHPDAQAYQNLGRLYLAKHEFDKAIDQFEKALKLDEKNAQLHSDYGAALTEMGKAAQLKDESGKSLEEFARGLEHLSRAIDLDGSLLEAIFNRALLRQYMMQLQQAEDDWRVYIEKDPHSKWADEARRNLQTLEEQKKKRAEIQEQLLNNFLDAYQSRNDERAWNLISQNKEAVSGKLIFEQLLKRYLDASLKGLPDANSKLQVLSYVAKLEAERTGDRYVPDLALFYHSVSVTQQLALAQAHDLMATGHKHYVSSRLDAAIDSYSKARNFFYHASDLPEAGYAEYWMGLCYLETARVQQSLQLLQRLANICEQRKHQWLLAQILNSLGNVHTVLKEYSKATEYTSRALAIAEKIQDTYGQQKHLAQLANEYKDMGNYHQALAFLHQNLSLARLSWSGSRQMWRNYDTTARTFTLMGLYMAAADYGKEALQVALEGQDPGLMYVSYVHLGIVYGKLQNFTEAIRHAERGFQIAQSFSNEPAGLDMMAYSSLQLGNLNREGLHLDEAIVHYDRAIQLNHDLNYQVWLYEAHKGKLLCGIAQKNDALAEEELPPTLSLFQQYRSKIQEESNRNAFFSDQQNIYDVAIDFAYSRMNDAQKALEYAESSRARSLLDLTSANAHLIHRNNHPELLLQFDSKPVAFLQIQNQLPPETQVLEYSVLNDKLLIWSFSKTYFSVTRRETSLEQLSEEVRDFLRLVSRPDEENTEELRRAATGLYDILIPPLEPVQDGQKLLCIIPDKILNYLPFGALISPTSGQYLASHYLTVFCPSANMFLVCSNRAHQREGEIAERVLSVGNPRFDSSAFPSLPELPSSEKEAEAVAACYASSCLLTGSEAREARVKNEMERSDVIHLASHYVIDEQSPMLSKLVLGKEMAKVADGGASDGILQAYEIHRLNLRRARLVVLSACQTGVEKYYNGEGMIGMARTFIAARVPLVIASLWAVDSAASTELMISFHRYRKQGGLPTVEALRRAQMDMATGPEPRYRQPYYWASFMAIGGYATF